MSLEFFEKIMKQSKGKVQQIALGGSGNPDDHEQFEEILKCARTYGIVPSYTTSGINVTNKTAEITKEYCGAVAVSWQHPNEYRDMAICRFLNAGCITNIHYVLSTETIDELLWQLGSWQGEKFVMLEYEPFVKGISNVILLTYKPIGKADGSKLLKHDDPRLKELARLIDNNKAPFGVGVDACMVPLLLNHCKKVNLDSISSCDAATYSAYITADGYMMACSMDVQNYNYAVDLNKYTMREAWESETFNKFRDKLRSSCKSCSCRTDCLGGCHLIPSITLCNKPERDSNV
jgi:radical SAM protein with 4Fe4S-binding SPASM domain